MTSDQPPNLCVTAAMRAASRRLTMLYDEVMAPSGLRVTQFNILSELNRRTAEPPTVGELSDILVMERSALGQTLRPLERDGLVELGRDPRDGRRRPVLLTAKGRTTVTNARRYWKEAHERFGRYFGEAPMADLRTTLRAIADDPVLADAFEQPASTPKRRQS